MHKLVEVFRVYGWTGGVLLIFYKLFYSKLQAFKSSVELLEWAQKNHSELRQMGKLVTLKGLPLFPKGSFSFRPLSSDPMVVRQHFFQPELKPVVDYFQKENKMLNLMIDAGGNIGASACFMHLNFPEMRSLVIEPSSENAKMADSNLHNFQSKVWEKALWWRTELLNFDESRSAWAMRVSRGTKSKGKRVEGIALSSILKLPEFANPDYIKIDIEGSEEDVFEKDENLGELLDKVSCISVEPHSEKGKKLIDGKLKEWGFKVEFHGELIIGFR